MKELNGFPKLLVCVWLWEASAVLVILSLYRMESEPDLLASVSHLGFKFLVAATMLLACMSLLVRWFYAALIKEGNSPFRFLLRWNIVPLILIITIAEVVLRVFSTDTLRGTPRQLTAASHFHHPGETLDYDQSLGWSMRANVHTSDGMYFTGDRGMRVSQSGIKVSARPVACRIALVGDSHTSGEELKFEETWGYLLGEYLPQQCQILNFGVAAYSVGQMYLRYIQDVRTFHPDMVIFALSSNTAARTMGVYGLNIFPTGLSWAQPRFELRDHELVPINLPLPSLETIANTRSMSDLPYIDYDRFFVPGIWELPRWRYLYNSYLFRLYVTWFPLWRTQYKGNSIETINHALLRSFLLAAKREGTTPVVLYLPDTNDYRNGGHEEMPSRRILRTSGIEYLDLRSCLDEIPDSERFIPNGKHYSLKGSTAIAQCIAARLPHLKPLPPSTATRDLSATPKQKMLETIH